MAYINNIGHFYRYFFGKARMKMCNTTNRYIVVLVWSALLTHNIYSLNKGQMTIATVSASIGAIAYGHGFLPWYTNKRQEKEKKHKAAVHQRAQEELRALYRTINSAYNAATIPLETSSTLFAYKARLISDIKQLDEALDFDWDDPTEKATLEKLLHYLKNHEIQIAKLIGIKIGQETQQVYKDELALIARDTNVDTAKMSKIVFEKFGNTQLKFTNYKNALLQSIIACKQFGAPQEMIDALDNLNKVTNFLFANGLDSERTEHEHIIKQEKLFNAELDNKYAIKDFYKEAQHYVQQASNTVTRCSEEMDRQNHIQQKLIDNCTLMLQNLTSMFTTWSIRSEQQTERVVQEVRQESHITREVVKTSANAKNIAIEQKINAIERKAAQAQQTAQSAKQQASTAQNMADAALGPTPPNMPYV